MLIQITFSPLLFLIFCTIFLHLFAKRNILGKETDQIASIQSDVVNYTKSIHLVSSRLNY